VATDSQLTDAFNAGADWCSTGWLSDVPDAKYPINTSIKTGCADEPGVKTYTPDLAGVNCFGPKPDKGTEGIVPFDQFRWSRWDSTSRPEVYNIHPYNWTKDQAASQCMNYGGVVAADAQLTAAYKGGADWCSTGWLSDVSDAKYPINTSIKAGCAGQAGIVTYTPQKAGVNCLGPKPAASSNTDILPFNEKKWSQY
jgi:hypothetical protein